MTTPTTLPPLPEPVYQLTRSIIHDCPAIKLPQSYFQTLGMTAQIVALKGASNEFAEAVVAALNQSAAYGLACAAAARKQALEEAVKACQQVALGLKLHSNHVAACGADDCVDAIRKLGEQG